MFSGFGVYAEDVCFALYLRGEFYLKADETTIPRFVAEGSEHFSYSTRAKTVSVKSWWRMPIRLYDEPEELADWARQAVAVAAKVRLKKVARKRPVSKAKRNGSAAKAALKKMRAPSTRVVKRTVSKRTATKKNVAGSKAARTARSR
jgi:DNA transformation protein